MARMVVVMGHRLETIGTAAEPACLNVPDVIVLRLRQVQGSGACGAALSRRVIGVSRAPTNYRVTALAMLARNASADPYSPAMSSAPARLPDTEPVLRRAVPGDLDALVALEQSAFAADQMSRRSYRRMLGSHSAAVIVAEIGGEIAGCAIVLFRDGATVARLYSIAVAPNHAGRRLGARLLDAAEEEAIARACMVMRLEVHEGNARAIARYQKAGYRLFGRHEAYYEDKGDALRFEKRLTPELRGLTNPPPYFHQTTEFTCGPACITMALAWADPTLTVTPALEFRLWREATTIFTTSGPGGCEPFGLAVTLKRHGLSPEIHVSEDGPYFLDTVQSDDNRRVMRVIQEDFRREAEALRIKVRLAPLGGPALMDKLGSGAVAIVLVSGYHMIRRNLPHWVFAFGGEGSHILLHDPAALRDKDGKATSTETYAVPIGTFERLTRYGRNDLQATIVIRKGNDQ